jgi:hypothetical protein
MAASFLSPVKFFDVKRGATNLYRGYSDDGILLYRGCDLTLILDVGPIKTFRAIDRSHWRSAVFPVSRGGHCRGVDEVGARLILDVVPDSPHVSRVRAWLEKDVFPLSPRVQPTVGPYAAPKPEYREDFSASEDSSRSSGDHEPRPIPGSEIVRSVDVRFGDDTIPVIPGDGRDDWSVVLKPTCEAMGVSYSGQFEKLQREHWATIRLTRMVSEDGKVREVATIDRKTFKMWMLKFTTSRIADPVIRAKIERYQIDAMDFIDRFFGDDLQPKHAPLSPVPSPLAGHATLSPALESALLQIVSATASLDSRLRAIEAGTGRQERRHISESEVPSGYYRFTDWLSRHDISETGMQRKFEILYCKNLSYHRGFAWHRFVVDGRTEAYYFHESVLSEWMTGYLRKNPRASTKLLPFRESR